MIVFFIEIFFLGGEFKVLFIVFVGVGGGCRRFLVWFIMCLGILIFV